MQNSNHSGVTVVRYLMEKQLLAGEASFTDQRARHAKNRPEVIFVVPSDNGCMTFRIFASMWWYEPFINR